jgi:hypothetical protein
MPIWRIWTIYFLGGYRNHYVLTTCLLIINICSPGYIAGVTNPAFKDHAEWWDVLCDIKTGRIMISSKIAPAQPIPSNAKDSVLGGSDDSSSRARDYYDIEFVQDVSCQLNGYCQVIINSCFI